MSTTITKKNIPELRFHGFSGEWENVKLGQLVKIERGASPRPISNFIVKDGSGMPWIKIGDTAEGIKYIKSTKEKVNKEGASKSREVHKGDFLLSNSMSFGKPFISAINGFVHDGWLILRNQNKDRLSDDFLYHLLGTDVTKEKFLRLAAGSAVKNLKSETVKKTQISLPAKREEQLKISVFLNACEEWVTNLGKQKKILEEYKRGMMQKIFSQEVRFKDENGKDFPEWELKKLSSFLTERDEQAPKSDKYPLMAFVAYKGVTPKGERYNREFLVNDSDNKKYKRTEYGDFIYSSNNLETGSIGLNRYGSASISPVYSIFQIGESCDYQFMSSYLVRKSFLNKMIRYRQGVVYGQWKIRESDFLKIEEKIPSLKEQKKIANFLTSLDRLIESKERQIYGAEIWKKGLLQKMFV